MQIGVSQVFKPAYALALGAFASLASGSAALAQSAGCADIDGFSSSLVAIRVDNILSSLAFSAGDTLTISGTSATHTGSGSDGWYVSDPLSGIAGAFGSAPLSSIFTATGVAFSETFVVPVGGMLSFGLSETGPNFTDLADVTITCLAGSGGSDLIILSGFAQQQSITTSLGRNYRNRFALAGGAPLAGNGLFTSTKGGNEEVSAWVSTTGRAFWDGYEGGSLDLSFGVDRFVSANTLVGVMVGLNQLSVSDASGAETDATAAMIGLYAAHDTTDGILTDGNIALARTSYDASGSSFDTTRVMVGLGVSAVIEKSTGILQPRARITGAWEDFPGGVTGVVAGNTRQIIASVGARYDWAAPLAGTALKPFISLDLEYASLQDTSGVQDDILAPRFGLGVNGTVGTGTLSASIDIGQTAANVYDAGIDISYEFTF